MKNIVLKFIIASIVVMAAQAFGETNANIQTNKDFTVINWMKAIKDSHARIAAAGFADWLYESKENQELVDKDKRVGIAMVKFFDAVRYTEVWNDMIKRYPDTKNGRIAICEYGKKQYIISRENICDENFIPDINDIKVQLPKGLRSDPLIQPISQPKK